MRIYGKSKKKKKIFLQLLAKYSYLCSPQLERCSSGLRGTPGKRVYAKSVSRVRIPISPQNINTQLVAKAIGCFCYWPGGELAHRQDNDGNSQAGPPGQQLCTNALAPPRRRREGMRRPPCGRAQSRSLRRQTGPERMFGPFLYFSNSGRRRFVRSRACSSCQAAIFFGSPERRTSGTFQPLNSAGRV